MPARKPEWIRTKSPLNAETRRVRDILKTYGLHTVCQSAACPNLGLCFAEGTAAFLIMGAHCTRDCRFCAVKHGDPEPLDPGEPERIARAAAALGLNYAVVTSVTRDDLPDGGAAHFAAAVEALHARGIRVEVLTPDFRGDADALAAVVRTRPEVFNHNIETVPRLYPLVRPRADYERSLELLARVKRLAPEIPTKSGLMVGLGETDSEVEEALRDLRRAGCDRVTIGQYLQPSLEHLPVAEYIPPERFSAWESFARGLGFSRVDSGPLVRSSFHAGVH